MFDVYKFKSNKLGPHILILGAVHGNEIAGTLAGESIALDFEIGNLKLIKGSVTFIPLVNKKAQEQDTRFVDENLNRVIIYHPNPTTHEQKIANNLLQHIEKADVLLDLHSTHCEKDEAFAFIDYPTKQNCELLQVMPVQTALAGWPSIYEKNTKILNYSTEEYAHMKGITALTLDG